MMLAILFVRLLFTLILLYYVCKDAGMAVGVFAVLISVAIEITIHNVNILFKLVKMQHDHTNKMFDRVNDIFKKDMEIKTEQGEIIGSIVDVLRKATKNEQSK